MPNSEGMFDNFVWSEDEVELLLNVVLEHKTARTAENFYWQTCQTNYTDILDLFRAYLLKRHAWICGTSGLAHNLTLPCLYLRGFVVHT